MEGILLGVGNLTMRRRDTILYICKSFYRPQSLNYLSSKIHERVLISSRQNATAPHSNSLSLNDRLTNKGSSTRPIALFMSGSQSNVVDSSGYFASCVSGGPCMTRSGGCIWPIQRTLFPSENKRIVHERAEETAGYRANDGTP